MTAPEILADIQQNWMLYAAMPLVAAGIGYVTKILAIKMMFGPLEFIGIKPYLGWQGVVPRKAARMAETAVDTLTRRLLDPAEIWAKLDRDELIRQMEKPLLEAAEAITSEVASTYQPGLWEALPNGVRQRIIKRVQAEAPAAVHEMMEDIQKNITKVFDLKDMMVTNLTRDKRVLVRIFQETGRKEFAFIRNSGIWFGLAIGMVQAVTWAFTYSPWVMPLFGGFVGWFSDWLTLKMVFRPMEPKKFFFGLFTWQGLFLKRRLEVCSEHGTLIANEILTSRHLFEAALTGPASDQLYALVSRHVQQIVDEQSGIAKPLVVLALGTKRYQDMKKDVAEKLMQQLPETLQHVQAYADQALDIRTTLIAKMQQMSPEEFEGLLRPVFKEDEWILITLGAVLGSLVGELQVQIMLG